jgi:hypothetical protein
MVRPFQVVLEMPLNLSLTCARAKGARSGRVGHPAQGHPCVGRDGACAMCQAWRTETAAGCVSEPAAGDGDGTKGDGW